MGTSTAANRATKALRLARTSGSAGTRRRAMYPRKSTSSTAVLVSRASHAHHTPHVGLPQIDPEIERAHVEHHADLDRRRGQPVPEQRPGPRPEVEQAGHGGQTEGQVQRHPGHPGWM